MPCAAPVTMIFEGGAIMVSRSLEIRPILGRKTACRNRGAGL